VDEKGNITYERPRVTKEDAKTQAEAYFKKNNQDSTETQTTPKSSPLPQQSQKDKSTQQPYEGMRVTQEGNTYEYRNGEYIPVE
jgi:hypothetical protein